MFSSARRPRTSCRGPTSRWRFDTYPTAASILLGAVTASWRSRASAPASRRTVRSSRTRESSSPPAKTATCSSAASSGSNPAATDCSTRGKRVTTATRSPATAAHPRANSMPRVSHVVATQAGARRTRVTVWPSANTRTSSMGNRATTAISANKRTRAAAVAASASPSPPRPAAAPMQARSSCETSAAQKTHSPGCGRRATGPSSPRFLSSPTRLASLKAGRLRS